jgi:hypothetical protein
MCRNSRTIRNQDIGVKLINIKVKVRESLKVIKA